MAEQIIKIPQLSLVLLIGQSGCGKSTFAREHFGPSEIVSSDQCRAMVSDDENDQSATKDAFELLHFIAGKRLSAGKLTVIDATNIQPEARKSLVALAREHHVLPVGIVLDMPKELCHARNEARPDRQFGKHVVNNQHDQLRRSLKHLSREGLRQVAVLSSPEAVALVRIERQPLWNDLRQQHGPFDIIGDVHGCYDELRSLLVTLGYPIDAEQKIHPEGRKAVFVGDLVDRGPKTPDVLRLVMVMVEQGAAYCVNGNHDDKLKRKLQGRDVKIAHGLAESLAQLEQEPIEFTERVIAFLDGLRSHYVFEDGKLAVAHAGLKEKYIGRASPRIRDFCMYGETTGETDEFGLPVRYPWATDYRGKTAIVYGHTPVPEAEWLNNTLNLDTGCVFGGKLTALRYPEREIVSVPAAEVYCEPIRPLQPEVPVRDDMLDIDDVLGKRLIETRLYHSVTIREENAIAALEVMSRFAIDPRWLIYLPPTMSPTETSKEPDLLEHPAEAFAFYRKHGIEQVICEEKHMGSRAIVVLCRDTQTAARRFGATEGEIGVCYSRTGRDFFGDPALSQAFLARVAAAIGKAGLWDELHSDWLCLDAELLPWSAKAQSLLVTQYAPVASAGLRALPEGVALLAEAAQAEGITAIHKKFGERAEMLRLYRDAYRRYCWPVSGLDNYHLAPFHLLASENACHMDKDHAWHLGLIDRLSDADPAFFRKTARRIVRPEDAASVAEAVQWWSDLTVSGGEGIVVKPLAFTAKGPKGLVQPGIKCRGREYLRLIYGPEYTAPEHLERLRARGLSEKRSLALREYALGYEALQRFAAAEPLYRVHECVFGVLALESEPVDPRL